MTQRLEDNNEPESPIIANIRRGVIGQQEEEAIMGGLAEMIRVWMDAHDRVATMLEEERQKFKHPNS